MDFLLIYLCRKRAWHIERTCLFLGGHCHLLARWWGVYWCADYDCSSDLPGLSGWLCLKYNSILSLSILVKATSFVHFCGLNVAFTVTLAQKQHVLFALESLSMPFRFIFRMLWHEEQHTLLMRVSKRPSEGLSLWSLLEPLVASPSGAKQLRRWLQQPSILASPTHHHHLGTFKLCGFSHQNFSPRQTAGGAERTSGCYRATHGIVARLQCRGGQSLEEKKLMLVFIIFLGYDSWWDDVFLVDIHWFYVTTKIYKRLQTYDLVG